MVGEVVVVVFFFFFNFHAPTKYQMVHPLSKKNFDVLFNNCVVQLFSLNVLYFAFLEWNLQ